jgi:hypothetical protein
MSQDSTFEIECDVCGDEFPKTSEISLPWDDVSVCSVECKLTYLNWHDRRA